MNGPLQLDGTLMVTNLGPAIAAGDSFQLFSAGSIGGAFAATNLPPLNPGLAWNFNSAAGLLSVSQTTATNPTNISFTISGGSLTLAWPDDHIGWRLQVQTNDLVSGLGTNWFDVNGSTLTNAANFLIDPASGNVFYRMIFP